MYWTISSRLCLWFVNQEFYFRTCVIAHLVEPCMAEIWSSLLLKSYHLCCWNVVSCCWNTLYIAVEPSTIVFCWNLLKLCCWNVLVLLVKCYSLSPLCLFKYFDFLVGSPWVPRNPMGLGDGRKTSPTHGDGDGDGFTIFSWGWVWEGKTRWVSSPLPSWNTPED